MLCYREHYRAGTETVKPAATFELEYLNLHGRTSLELYTRKATTNVHRVEILALQLWFIYFICISTNATLPMMM